MLVSCRLSMLTLRAVCVSLLVYLCHGVVERLALVLGGEIVSTFDQPDKVKIGHCDKIEEVIIGEDKVGGMCCQLVSLCSSFGSRVLHWEKHVLLFFEVLPNRFWMKPSDHCMMLCVS